MRYAGGKNQVFRALVNLMPPHSVYIEAFLGSGPVLRYKSAARINIGIDLDEHAIVAAREWAKPGTRLIHGDAFRFLDNYPFSGDEMLFCDPPYLPTTRRKQRIYKHELTVRDHERLVGLLATLNCRVMLSGYPNTLYSEALRDWQQVELSVTSHVGPRKELLWLNYDPPEVPHDTSYLGSTFRDREQIHRRHQRLISRIRRLSAGERSMLWRHIGSHYRHELELASALEQSAGGENV